MLARKLAAVSAVAVLALGLTACGSDDDGSDTASSDSSSSSDTASPSASAMMDEAEFGPGCAAVPKDAANPGSFEAMSKVPVATAASGNPLLSTLVAAVKAAGLVDTLNNAPAITVFAPTNDAFAKIPKADLDKVLADKATLTKILTYHVVGSKLSPDKLAGTQKSLQGGDVTVAGASPDFKVNSNSTVVCGNVQTANATVYLVDTVLMPPA